LKGEKMSREIMQINQNYLECENAKWTDKGYGNILSCTKTGKEFPKNKKYCQTCKFFEGDLVLKHLTSNQ